MSEQRSSTGGLPTTVRSLLGFAGVLAAAVGIHVAITLLAGPAISIVAGHHHSEGVHAHAASGHGAHVLLLAAGIVAYAVWAALDIGRNGRPGFSWRLRPVGRNRVA